MWWYEWKHYGWCGERGSPGSSDLWIRAKRLQSYFCFGIFSCRKIFYYQELTMRLRRRSWRSPVLGLLARMIWSIWTRISSGWSSHTSKYLKSFTHSGTSSHPGRRQSSVEDSPSTISMTVPQQASRNWTWRNLHLTTSVTRSLPIFPSSNHWVECSDPSTREAGEISQWPNLGVLT